MLLSARLTRTAGVLPPVQDVRMVREESRTCPIVIHDVPAGRTVVQVIDTGKLRASDADAAKIYQKNLTATSDAATVGQITDAGATGTARAVIQFVPGDSTTWPDRMVRQIWVKLDTGAQFCVLTGAVTTLAPIPLALPASSIAGVTVDHLAIATPQATAVAVGATVDLTVTVFDVLNAPLAGKSVTATPSNGNATVSYPNGQTSDASGHVVVRVTGANVGSVSLTATSDALTSPALALTVVTALTNPTLLWNVLADRVVPRIHPAAYVPRTRSWTGERRAHFAADVMQHDMLHTNGLGNYRAPEGGQPAPGATNQVTATAATTAGVATQLDGIDGFWVRCTVAAYDAYAAANGGGGVPYAEWGGTGASVTTINDLRKHERALCVATLLAGDAGAVGKRVILSLESTDALIVYGRQDVILQSTTVPQYVHFEVVIRTPNDTSDLENAMKRRLRMPNATDRALNVLVGGFRCIGNPAPVRVPPLVSYMPIHEGLGLSHQWQRTQCWVDNLNPVVAAGTPALHRSAVIAPVRVQHPTEPEFYNDVTFAQNDAIGAAESMSHAGQDSNNITNLNRPPAYSWIRIPFKTGTYGGVTYDALPADGDYVAYYDHIADGANTSDSIANYTTASVPLARDPDQLCERVNGVVVAGYYSARIPVNALGQNAKLFNPRVKRSATGTKRHLVGPGLSVPEQFCETRTTGWHSMITGPAAPMVNRFNKERPLIIEGDYTVLPKMQNWLRRDQGIFGGRFVMPYDIWSMTSGGGGVAAGATAARGTKFDWWQSGPGASADLGFQGEWTLESQAGTIRPRMNVSVVTTIDNSGTPGTYDQTGSGFTVTAPGQIPPFTDIDFLVVWAGRKIYKFYLGIGTGVGRWYRVGDVAPFTGTLISDGSTTPGVGGVSPTLWEFGDYTNTFDASGLKTSDIWLGSDRDITGEFGGWSRGWIASKFDASDAEIEATWFAALGARAVHA